MAGKPSFQDHVKALDKLPAAGVACIYGPSEFLAGRAIAQLRLRAERRGAAYTSLEAGSLDELAVVSMGEQGSLFEPSTLYIVRRCEQAKALPRVLKSLSKAPSGDAGNLIAFVYKGESPAAPLKTELSRLGAQLVPCFDPWPNEMAPIVQQIALERGLKLAREATALLLDSVGADLVKLDNELAKAALVHGQDGAEVNVTAAMLAPQLGVIREDDAYKLDRLLLQGAWGRAHALANDLMERGERATALVGVLANHCRNALRVTDALKRGVRPADVTSSLRMPAFVAKAYVQSLAGADPARYARALAACGDADARLKSSRVDEGLLVASIIDALA
jgi:DNA polymerase III delta subunit